MRSIILPGILSVISVVSSIFLIHSGIIYAEEVILPEIIVPSQRSALFLSTKGCETIVLNREDIKKFHVRTVAELLGAVSSVDLSERGTPSSQADLSIRGSSFEGVMVLVNGINVRDPQTGHFTMDVPVDLNSVERVEILTGGGSTMYGSQASGGVINIVTRNDVKGANGGVSIGSHGSREMSAGFGGTVSGSEISGHFRTVKSDGYTDGSDLDLIGIDVTGSFQTDNVSCEWNAGVLDKQFGAQGFYAPYPSFEKTRTFLGGVNIQRSIDSNSLLRFRAGARGQGDDFILIRNDPGVYRNTHYNRSYVLAGEYSTAILDAFTGIVGVESSLAGISSGSLGSHSDRNDAVYGELSGGSKYGSYSLALRYDSGFRDEHSVTYGAGIEVPVSATNHLRLRAEKSFRSPTYTELYYDSPANRGNRALNSELSQSFEAGIEHSGNRLSLGLAVFTRKSTDVIDWIREEGEAVWETNNHGEIQTSGIEMKSRLTIGHTWMAGVSAMVLDQSVERRAGIESKYALNPAATVVSGGIAGNLPAGFACSVRARYENILHGDERVPVTVSCSKSMKSVTAILSVTNVFDERYDEIPGLRAPGRWITLRMEYSR